MTEKETDTHMGSEDGHGVFNWRMKFSLEIPCPFPRLKFLIYDFNAFSSSDAIGTCVISFMKFNFYYCLLRIDWFRSLNLKENIKLILKF